MGDIIHLLDDVTRFSLIYKTDLDWYMEPCPKQCSRLKPSYEFHFERISNFSPSIDGLVQIQDANLKI